MFSTAVSKKCRESPCFFGGSNGRIWHSIEISEFEAYLEEEGGSKNKEEVAESPGKRVPPALW